MLLPTSPLNRARWQWQPTTTLHDPSNIITLEGLQVVRPSGVPSEEAFGTATQTGGDLILTPVGIASAEAVGTPRLQWIISPVAISSGETFGDPRVVRKIKPTAIASAQAFGTPKLGKRLFPSSIGPSESFGTPRVVRVIKQTGYYPTGNVQVVETFATDPGWTPSAGYAAGFVNAGAIYARSAVPVGGYSLEIWPLTDVSGAQSVGQEYGPYTVSGIPASGSVPLGLHKGLAGSGTITFDVVRTRLGVDTTIISNVVSLAGSTVETLHTVDLVNGDQVTLIITATTGSPGRFYCYVRAQNIVGDFYYRRTQTPVAEGTRVGYKAVFSNNSVPWNRDRAGVYIEAADESEGVYFTVGESNIYLNSLDFLGVSTAAHGINFSSGGTYWFTVQLSVDRLSTTASIWTSAPPLTGGTPAFTVTVTGLTAPPDNLYPSFYGSGDHRFNTSDAAIQTTDSRYDDFSWTIVSALPEPNTFGTPSVYILIVASSIPPREQFGSHLVSSRLIVYSDNFPLRQKWQIYLAYSAHIVPGTSSKPPTAGLLSLASDMQLDIILNRPGACKFAVPLDDIASSLVVPLQTCILAVRDGIVRWSGPVKTVDQDLSSNSMSVSAEGWLSLLDGRKIRQLAGGAFLVRETENDEQRVMALFAHVAAQKDTYGNPIPMAMTYGGHTGLPRNLVGRVIYQPGPTLGSLVNGLSEIENGFDIYVDPVTRIMTTHRSLIKGGVYGYGSDKPGALFSYNVGNDNLKTMRQTIDASNIANIVNAIGPTGQHPQRTDDPDSIATFGAFEDDFSMTDQGIDENELEFGAAAEVFYRKDPRVLYTVSPFPWFENGNVPRLFEDFDIGDVGRLAAQRGWLTIPPGLKSGQTQPIRFYGASITVTPEGDENINSLQLAPS